jgi:hypothetical protein
MLCLVIGPDTDVLGARHVYCHSSFDPATSKELCHFREVGRIWWDMVSDMDT